MATAFVLAAVFLPSFFQIVYPESRTVTIHHEYPFQHQPFTPGNYHHETR
jgi:hypothetical protein